MSSSCRSRGSRAEPGGGRMAGRPAASGAHGGGFARAFLGPMLDAAAGGSLASRISTVPAAEGPVARRVDGFHLRRDAPTPAARPEAEKNHPASAVAGVRGVNFMGDVVLRIAGRTRMSSN